MQNSIASKLKALVSKKDLRTKVATTAVATEQAEEHMCVCGGNCGCHD
ncbi:MAG TPA: hypothetical protein VLI92_03150 [Candidatus Saccharimonadales bacterium]|nr:hypothetical protein [Candidatus Saccharimonadales bacterium]